ncbi:hypothetical protein EN868_11185 [Mesorhizobium sp. M2D.F.Ca.ET.225.01.1.1]|uniref:YfbU family protein n=1 Tax=unclassified Mesorhizobium TaxID=325217 RepID=UPI000FD4B422|nr:MULTISPECIES: YfbU family protein [unclassified Mesorhizobium]TGP59548.1 hypothetical protein EN869_014855 [Mesorhizobium sp. M2D.F.Ca.ET.226.01.1.1]TGP69183.1 hypothetical protein EN868_11185 [Mesorhizobium sp. M2D.F.Ca.ET.225.01.1.1]
MVDLNFSPEQRLIIALLCDLYKEPAKRELDPGFIMEAIYGGHDWAIDWQYGGVFPERSDKRSDVSYVVDVLDMWTFIERGFDTLDAAGKAKVQAGVAHIGQGPKFLGFDGNNETTSIGIANMLVDKMGRFAAFKGRDLNSHSPTEDRYRQMLDRWLPIRPGLHARELNADEIIHILSR